MPRILVNLLGLWILSSVVACTAPDDAGSGGPQGGEALAEDSSEKPEQAATPTQDESYDLVEPSEFAFELQDFYYNGAVAADGVEPIGGEIGKLLCDGREIALASTEFDDGHIVTRDFGRIKVRFSSSLTSSGFAVFLKPSQKKALMEFVQQ